MRSLTPNLQLLDARTLQRLLGVALPALMLVWGLKAGLSGLTEVDHAGFAILALAWCAVLFALRTRRLHPLKAQRAALLALTSVIVAGHAAPFALPGAAPVDVAALGAGVTWLLFLQQLFFVSYPPRRAGNWVLGVMAAQALPPLLLMAVGGPGAESAWAFAPQLLNHLLVQACLLVVLYLIAGQIFKLAAWGSEAAPSPHAPLHINELLAKRTEGLRQLLDTARAHEAELRAMLDAFPGVVARTEGDTTFSYVNTHFAALFGRRQDELIGMSMLGLEGPELHSQSMARRTRILASGLPERYERSFTLADGSVREFLLTQFAVEGPPGMPRRHYTIGIDIGERKRAERAQAQAVAEAERANRAKSEFLSHMSHELRTPLNGVLGFTQLLRANVVGLRKREQDWLRAIEHSTRHLAALVDDVLDQSCIEAGEMRVQRIAVDLAELADVVREAVQAVAKERDIEVRLQCGSGPLCAWGDALRVRQVLLNLISNAIKYNRRGGRVEIQVLARGDDILVAVADTGPGLSDQQRAQLFTPYERLGAERGQEQGTGIGLSIARRLAQLMQGDIEVDSIVGEGSCFTLRLPAAPSAEPPYEPSPTDFSDLAPTEHSDGFRVLYVEDNEVNRLVFEACLNLRPGVELHLAHDGKEALRLAATMPLDLIVLDLNLPDTSGLALARELQARPNLQGTRLALLTADTTPETLKAAKACGISRVWHKPFEVAALLAEIDDALTPA